MEFTLSKKLITALLCSPITCNGKIIAQDVVGIKWEANNKDFHLLNERFDEFSFFTRLPTKSGFRWISVRQECTKGLKTPVALLELLPSIEHHQH